ncbi:hypothetical protein NA8A_09129 [Nitratireductor indicus C115]|uniref:Metal-binding protein n=1 Tax=Nitratireductor indicus C115 TaxID=1231190 RepID=K2N5T3_9HYPH|nr:DUF177 domain-containing protein [Nitratireductor indicus]EKF42818.1 hypothetical protein NA8A_09129 [Nitratireductor indicus C115]SFQ40733.1 Uncharacterized ACR, COG1399 [Nitratireductor indicus]
MATRRNNNAGGALSLDTPVSFKVNVLRLPRKGMPVEIEADEAQRQALAEQHGLLSVESFRAELTVRPWKADGIRVLGHVSARITQECVVTLEPLSAKVEEEISATLVPEGSRLARNDIEGGEFVLDAEGADMPEPFVGDTVDLGALAEEFFELGIDPYPRKPGTALAASSPPDEGEEHAGPLSEGLRKLGQKD